MCPAVWFDSLKVKFIEFLLESVSWHTYTLKFNDEDGTYEPKETSDFCLILTRMGSIPVQNSFLGVGS